MTELAGAVKGLLEALGLKQNQVAHRSGVSEGTISNVLAGKSCPHEGTFERIITQGCGQAWKPWQHAWARASGEHRRRQSAGHVVAEVNELRNGVQRLEGVIAELIAKVEAVSIALAERPSDAVAQQHQRLEGARFLARVGPADFPIMPGRRSPVLHVHEVDEFLGEVKRLALQDMAELCIFVLGHSGSFSPLLAEEAWDTGYDESEVHAYVKALRREVNRHLGVEPAIAADALAMGAPHKDDPWANSEWSSTPT
ncbi:helix-turn-helix transcriptional regulator [Streptomyces sp. CAI-155]|uniref:helix-turn-helix domain-containing protein n=1 Tax=Streptomyces sp. CAI-155 TaxID=1472660 RepID=UPI0015876C16|nr:helix-turn-helix transcriptional regulator [Streptomyces sp. CAI-155]NUV83382.1 helix-turn-helix transcriptional regulator [Streptomyces sp. CAI-155]